MLFSPNDLSECLREWDDLEKDYQQIQDTHRLYKQKLEEVSKLQTSCSSAIARQRKKLGELTLSLKGSIESIAEMEESIKDKTNVFFEMEAFLPKKNGLYLTLVLGNINVTLLNKQAKFAYKDEYEKFKLVLTVILFVFSFTCRFLFSYRVLDALFNFLLVWYYCTLTIRESILISNGSRSVTTLAKAQPLSNVPDGALYQMFRNQFLSYNLYQSFVQFLQYYYQSGCLYRLRALGERHTMDLTVGEKIPMFKLFIKPWSNALMVSQSHSSFPACVFLCFAIQVLMCGCSYMVLFMGNLFTTLRVVYQKYMNNEDKSKSM
uniref:Transmembrane protein 120Aa n=1 Tax=Cyprinodon variegatus TaxID=28743 RepID=A0A3Q2D408_CYPVA